MRRWALWLSVALLAGAAHGAPMPPCTEASSDSRCLWQRAGSPPLEATPRDEEVLRFLGSQALAPHDAFMAEFRRDRRGRVMLTLHDPDRPDNAELRPVPPGLWDTLVALRARVLAGDAAFHRRQEAEIARDSRAHPGAKETIVCTDAPDLSIESVLGGYVAHFDTQSCSGKAIFDALDRLPKLIYPRDPVCMRIDKDFRDICASLTGDRAIAASAVAEILEFDDLVCDPDSASALAPMIAPDSVIDMAGEGVQPLTVLARVLCKRRVFLYIKHIEAHGGRIFVSGTMEGQSPSKPELDSRVPFLMALGTQVWRVDAKGAKLERWMVGAFARIAN